jgi:hypothetical protein
LFALGVLLSPALLVKGTAWLLGSPVAQSASADQKHLGPDATTITPLTKVQLTDAQRRVAEHIASLRAKPFGPSPLFYATSEGGLPVETESIISADVNVQAVLGSAGGNGALVNGKLYRVGDTIQNSPWIVSAIDPAARSITIRHETTGEVETHAVPIPGAAGGVQPE